MLCTKLAHFKFDACYRSQNSWEGRHVFNHVFHGVLSPLHFKTVWRRLGIEVMSFWSFGVRIWSHSCLIYIFPSAEEFVVIFDVFLFNDVPNVLYRWKIWNAGRPIQHPDSSTTKHLHGVCDFQQECQIWARLTIEPFSTSKQSILNEPWHKGHDGASVSCSHMASFLHDWALVGMLMSDAASSEGPKTMGILQVSSALSLTHRDFSSFSESFDDVMHYRWWDLQSLCSLTLRNVVF